MAVTLKFAGQRYQENRQAKLNFQLRNIRCAKSFVVRSARVRRHTLLQNDMRFPPLRTDEILHDCQNTDALY